MTTIIILLITLFFSTINLILIYKILKFIWDENLQNIENILVEKKWSFTIKKSKKTFWEKLIKEIKWKQ